MWERHRRGLISHLQELSAAGPLSYDLKPALLTTFARWHRQGEVAEEPVDRVLKSPHELARPRPTVQHLPLVGRQGALLGANERQRALSSTLV